jgi:hypothetical protein
MTGLRAADLRSVLELTAVGLTVTDFAQVPPLLGALAAVVGSDSATLTHLDLYTGRELVALWPPARAHSTVLERYPAVGATHPLRGPRSGLSRWAAASRSGSPTSSAGASGARRRLTGRCSPTSTTR